MDDHEYEIELDGALNLAKLAGSIMMQYYDQDYDVEQKEGHQAPESAILTEVDEKIDKLVQLYFQQNWADDGLLTEETTAKGEWHKSDRIWIVDPIDGTMGYKKKTECFGISIALIEDDRPVLGVLYAPAQKLLAYAIQGKGSYLNGEKIDLGQNSRIKNIICSRNAYQRRGYQKILQKLNPDDELGLVTLESVVVKAIRILQKEGEIYPVLPLSKRVKSVPKFWDIAAADIIIHEAGGLLTDFVGKKYRYNISDFRCKGGVLTGTQKGHNYALDKLK